LGTATDYYAFISEWMSLINPVPEPKGRRLVYA